MKSSNEYKANITDVGRAIAQASDEFKVQKEKNMAKAAKRKQSMLARAADAELGRNYSN